MMPPNSKHTKYKHNKIDKIPTNEIKTLKLFIESNNAANF